MKIKPYINIIRPINCLFAMLSTFIGFWYLKDPLPFEYLNSIIFAGLTTFFIAAAGNTINDYYDYEIDCLNKPDRVLPKGDIPVEKAKSYSFILLIIGLVFSIYTENTLCIIIAVINSLLLFVYAAYLKKRLIIGNLIVAITTASTFLFGAIISDNIRNLLPLIIFSAIYTLIREWVKVIEDHEGDLKQGVRSISTVFGQHVAVNYILYAVISLIILIIYYYYLGFYNIIKLILILKFGVLPIISFYIMLRKSVEKGNTARIQKYMKLNMVVLVLIYIGYGVII